MKQLVTILNRSDPTPTAMSIVSNDSDEVHILVVDYESYSGSEEMSLQRIQAWSRGSARGDGFPPNLWLDKLDWVSLDKRGITVQYHQISQLSGFDFSILGNDVIVDLLSGTKEQSGELMRLCQDACKSVEFVITQLNGCNVNLNYGNNAEPKYRLSIKERVWLSTGHVTLIGRAGSPEIGEAVKNWEFKYSDHPLKKKVKLVPVEKDKLMDILQMDGFERGENEGDWLEYFSADVVATWPEVQETARGVKIIPADFENFVSVSFTTMQIRHGDEEQEFNIGTLDSSLLSKPSGTIPKEEYIEWITSSDLNKSQLETIWDNAQIIDNDFIAMLVNGFFVIGECKDRARAIVENHWLKRIFSTSMKLFPTSSIPMLVHSGPKSRRTSIVEIIWPDLKEPLQAMDDYVLSIIPTFTGVEPAPPRSMK